MNEELHKLNVTMNDISETLKSIDKTLKLLVADRSVLEDDHDDIFIISKSIHKAILCTISESSDKTDSLVNIKITGVGDRQIRFGNDVDTSLFIVSNKTMDDDIRKNYEFVKEITVEELEKIVAEIYTILDKSVRY